MSTWLGVRLVVYRRGRVLGLGRMGFFFGTQKGGRVFLWGGVFKGPIWTQVVQGAGYRTSIGIFLRGMLYVLKMEDVVRIQSWVVHIVGGGSLG